jgi:hypothetical protein
VTVEVGLGQDRQWLVLGVGPQGITTLHTMPAGCELPNDITNKTSIKALAKGETTAAAHAAPRAAGRIGAGPGPGAQSLGPAAASDPTRAGTAAKVAAPPGRGGASSATFAQLIARLRTQAPKAASASKRNPGKPPRDSKPGHHDR